MEKPANLLAKSSVKVLAGFSHLGAEDRWPVTSQRVLYDAFS